MMPWVLSVLVLLSPPARLPATATTPQSPFSWDLLPRSNTEKAFAIDESILGVSLQPSSVSLVTLHDQRPYGETQDSPAWLVRYKQVPVPGPEGEPPTPVTLLLFFQVSTNQLIAACTEAAPVWAKTEWTSRHITERAILWEFFPLESNALHSSIVEVLTHLWKTRTVNPTRVGQITIRPRQFIRRTVIDSDDVPAPQSKSVGWVVEVLGTNIGVNPGGGPICTQLYVYRDGGLEFCGGLKL